MSSYQYRKSHCGDKTVVRSSYLHNGISYTGKMTSLYWIGALVSLSGKAVRLFTMPVIIGMNSWYGTHPRHISKLNEATDYYFANTFFYVSWLWKYFKSPWLTDEEQASSFRWWFESEAMMTKIWHHMPSPGHKELTHWCHMASQHWFP